MPTSSYWRKRCQRFWRRVNRCKHRDEDLSPNYLAIWSCGEAEGCHASESHCLKCGAYIGSCGCGNENGVSGWSHRRWLTENHRQRDARRTAEADRLRSDEYDENEDYEEDWQAGVCLQN